MVNRARPHAVRRRAFVPVVFVLAMMVPIVDVVEVIVVLEGRVPTVWTVLVIVVFMGRMFHVAVVPCDHRSRPSGARSGCTRVLKRSG